MTMSDSSKLRVPETLQQVLILSQHGREFKEPPPNGVAFRTFRWFARGRYNTEKTTATIFGDSEENPTSTVSKIFFLMTKIDCIYCLISFPLAA